MNGQYFGDRFNPSNNVEKNETGANTPVVVTDAFADKVPADAEMIHETPMGGTLVDAGPINEPMASVIPVYGDPAKEVVKEDMASATDRMEPTIPYRAPNTESSADNWGNKPASYQTPAVEQIKAAFPPQVDNPAVSAALLTVEDSEHFRTQWNEIQGKFVDEPRAAVQQADVLVADVVEKITQMFTSERTSLEGQWNQGNEVSTEDLRKALQRYRSFFNRLVV